jgi:hypothetical protein
MNGWNSQEHAFVEVIEALRRINEKMIFRIHPNTANKSWYELISLIAAIKDLQIKIVLPWDEISTYSLLQNASKVVTWGSTVCLESTAMGIPTYNLGRTHYDTIIDVKILTPQMVANNDFEPIQPGQLKSKIAIFMTRNWGYKLPTQNLYTLDDQHSTPTVDLETGGMPAKQVRLLASVVGNGLASKPNDLKTLLISMMGRKIGVKVMNILLVLAVKIYSRLK